MSALRSTRVPWNVSWAPYSTHTCSGACLDVCRANCGALRNLWGTLGGTGFHVSVPRFPEVNREAFGDPLGRLSGALE